MDPNHRAVIARITSDDLWRVAIPVSESLPDELVDHAVSSRFDAVLLEGFPRRGRGAHLLRRESLVASFIGLSHLSRPPRLRRSAGDTFCGNLAPPVFKWRGERHEASRRRWRSVDCMRYFEPNTRDQAYRTAGRSKLDKAPDPKTRGLSHVREGGVEACPR